MADEIDRVKITKGERTRRLILEAAAICIGENGIDKATTRLIAKKAKVSRGLINYHCPQTADLLKMVIDYIVQEVRQETRKDLEKLTTEDRIIQQVRGNFESFEKRPHYYRCFLLSYYYSSIKKEFSDLHRRIDSQTHQLWIELIQNLFRERKREKSKDEVAAIARSCIHEVEGSLMYFFVIPPESRKDYVENCVSSIQQKLS